MKGRGTVAYYLAAWICGSTFASIAVWIRNQVLGSPGLSGSPSGAGFFFLCFVGLVLGFLPALLVALFLRMLMRSCRLSHWVLWAVAGAVVAVALTSVLARIGSDLSAGSHNREGQFHILSLLALGPAILAANWWMPAIPGALTGMVLSRVESAFSS